MTKFTWAPWPLTQLFQSYKQIRTAENYSCELYSSTARYICHSTARLFWAAQPQSFHRGLGTTTPGNQVCRHHFWRVSVQYESGKNITKRILVTDSWHAFIGFFCLKPTNITPKTPPRWECWYPFTSTFPPFIHLFIHAKKPATNRIACKLQVLALGARPIACRFGATLPKADGARVELPRLVWLSPDWPCGLTLRDMVKNFQNWRCLSLPFVHLSQNFGVENHTAVFTLAYHYVFTLRGWLV